MSSKCTKIVGGWGFAPDPTGGGYGVSTPITGFKRPTSNGPTSKGREGNGREMEGGAAK